MASGKAAITLILSLILVSILSCEDDPVEPVVCTTESVYGLEIKLIDSGNGLPTGHGTAAVLTDGNYEETVVCVDMGSIGVVALAAEERAGTYDISIDAAGYQLWTRDNVRVTKDECHVKTVHIVAELVREDP